jgi:hypothetical protein
MTEVEALEIEALSSKSCATELVGSEASLARRLPYVAVERSEHAQDLTYHPRHLCAVPYVAPAVAGAADTVLVPLPAAHVVLVVQCAGPALCFHLR